MTSGNVVVGLCMSRLQVSHAPALLNLLLLAFTCFCISIALVEYLHSLDEKSQRCICFMQCRAHAVHCVMSAQYKSCISLPTHDSLDDGSNALQQLLCAFFWSRSLWSQFAVLLVRSNWPASHINRLIIIFSLMFTLVITAWLFNLFAG